MFYSFFFVTDGFIKYSNISYISFEFFFCTFFFLNLHKRKRSDFSSVNNLKQKEFKGRMSRSILLLTPAYILSKKDLLLNLNYIGVLIACFFFS